ncbi:MULTISPECIES: hypothetical protein [Streptomyces]|nr:MULTISPECIES: hypothetical protein [Streptomyces]
MIWPPTAPAVIAAVLGLIAIAMICASQHGIGTTNPQDPPDGDPP